MGVLFSFNREDV